MAARAGPQFPNLSIASESDSGTSVTAAHQDAPENSESGCAWWTNAVFKLFIFLLHAGVSLWLFLSILDTDEFCESASVNRHYAMEYVHNVLGDPLHPNRQTLRNGTWPVTAKNPKLDAAFTATADLNADRCRILSEEKRASEIANIVAGESLSRACALSGAFNVVEAIDEGRHTPVLGSRNNILFLILLFEWISSSFALFYLDIFDKVWSYWVGRFLTTYAPIAWNIGLIGFIMLAVSRDDIPIPTNNAILGTVLLTWAFLTHILYALPQGKEADVGIKPRWGSSIAPVRGEASIVHARGGAVNSDMLRLRRGGGKGSLATSGSIHFFKDAKPELLGIHWNGDRLETQKMSKLRERTAASELRYIEYAITAPLLFMGIQSTTVINSPVWPMQLGYVGIFLCNLYGVPLHQCLMFMTRINESRSKQGGGNTLLTVTSFLWWATFLLLAASWMAFGSAFVVYFASIGQFWNEYPLFVKILLVCLPIFYGMFGIVATWFYGKWLAWYRDLSYDTEKLRTDMEYMNTVFDTLSIIVKVGAALIVVTSDRFGPSAGCTTPIQ